MGHTSPHYQECPVTSRRKTSQVEGQEEEQVQGRRRGILLLQEEARRRRQLGRQRRLPHQEGQGAPRPLKALLERTQGPQGKDGPRRSRRGGDGPSPDLGSQAPRDRWLQPVDHHPTFFTFLLLPCPETWLRGPKHEPLPGQVRSLSAMGPPTPSSSLSLPPSLSFSLSLSPLLFLLLILLLLILLIPLLLRV